MKLLKATRGEESVMLDLGKILLDGSILALVGSILILAVVRFNPRLILNKGDVPKDILEAVPPKTKKEKRHSLLLGIPFLAWVVAVVLVSTLGFYRESGQDTSFLILAMHAFGVMLVFNLVDLVILDLLLFCTVTPKFMVIPGTEGLAGYKDYAFHLRAHARGTVAMAIISLIIGAIVSFA